MNQSLILERIAEGVSFDNYAVEENFLSIEESLEIRRVLEKYYQAGDLKKAGIGSASEQHVNKNIRGDNIRWIDPATALPPTQVFINRIRELMLFMNRTCYLGLKDVEMHYTVYPKGTLYQRHLDQFKHNDHRRLTFICYLNHGWVPADGGCLRIYLPGPDGKETVKDITPTAGKLVCFRSDLLEHEVLLSHRERYSLTGWMLDQLVGLTFLK